MSTHGARALRRESSRVVQAVPLVRLTQTVVDKAISAGVAAELGDDRHNGLVLRVNAGGKAVWQFRRNVGGRDYRRDIGGPWTLQEARDLVANLALALKRSGGHVIADEASLAAWLARYREVLAGRQAPAEEPIPAPATGPTFKEAAENWLEDAERVRKPKTALSYAGDLRVAEVRAMHDLQVTAITE